VLCAFVVNSGDEFGVKVYVAESHIFSQPFPQLTLMRLALDNGNCNEMRHKKDSNGGTDL
jgi:hypothetical protein